MVVTRRSATGAHEFYGASGETKPTTANIGTGSLFYESDTGLVYRYDGSSWFALSSSSTRQYTEGDSDASITGVAMLWENASDTLSPVSADTPLPVDAGSPVLAAHPAAIACDNFFNAALSNTAVAVKAEAATLYGYHLYNANAETMFLQLFNVVQGSVTVGTTTPLAVFAIRPLRRPLDQPTILPGLSFGVALTAAITTTPTGNGAPPVGLLTNLLYK